MRIAKEKVDVRLDMPGAVIRQRKDFGDVRGFETISGEYFSLSAGVDTTPLFEGLEGDLCQCPHWGYVLGGRLTTTDADESAGDRGGGRSLLLAARPQCQGGRRRRDRDVQSAART